jgi:ribonucleotide reductase alpha subunit
MWVVMLAADRTDDICQAQSVNLFFPFDADAEAIVQAHYYAWAWGVKSLYYLRSTTPKRAENTNTAVLRHVVDTGDNPDMLEDVLAQTGLKRAVTAPDFDLASLVAAAQPVEDEVCFSCQG